MSERLSSDQARRLILEPSNVEVWTLGHALDLDGPPLSDGVSAQLARDMLQVGETENWERTTRARELTGDLFRPYCVLPKDDGKTYRSWLPEDLTSGDESFVRAFAQKSSNSFVHARIFEILWSRFGVFEDANAAIEARFQSAAQCDVEEYWPRLVANMGRLTTLILALNARSRVDALVSALDAAADRLFGSTRPFSFPALAEMVCNTLLTKTHGRDAFSAERGKRWAELLAGVAKTYEGDPHHGHDALMVLQAWHGRWTDEVAVAAVRRRIVENLRDAGGKSDSQHAVSLYERALQAALDFGISDLSQATRKELMSAIQQAVPGFKERSASLTLPPEALAEIDRLLSTTPSLPAAIRQLSLLPGLLEIDAAEMRKNASEQLKEHVLLALIPTVHYHPDGKITFRSNDPAGNIERHAAFLIGGHLALVEGLLRYVLIQVSERLQPETLVEALGGWPHLATHRSKLLAIAAERFSKGDWVSSGYIVITLYEAILRDLLRAGGYSALKVEAGGVQMDETLNSLIRGAAARSVLGEAHCDLVEYMMCDPALGWNLRNEVAHGTVRADSLTPMRVFLAWLLVIRLTCFVAAGSGQASESTSE
jgi:hypothetical protein